jgi:hypothetical protein
MQASANKIKMSRVHNTKSTPLLIIDNTSQPLKRKHEMNIHHNNISKLSNASPHETNQTHTLVSRPFSKFNNSRVGLFMGETEEGKD